MSKIAELRASLPKPEVKKAKKLNKKWINESIDKAVNKLLDDIAKNPNYKHHYDVHVGSTNGHTYPENYHEYVVEFKRRVERMDSSLTAEASSYSNIGDPYFMGGENNRVSYSIRIKEV